MIPWTNEGMQKNYRKSDLVSSSYKLQCILIISTILNIKPDLAFLNI